MEPTTGDRNFASRIAALRGEFLREETDRLAKPFGQAIELKTGKGEDEQRSDDEPSDERLDGGAGI